MENIRYNYIRRNGITFELRAVNGDGEEILKETSQISFDDVSSFSGLLDDRFENMVVESEDAKNDDLINDQIKEERSY